VHDGAEALDDRQIEADVVADAEGIDDRTIGEARGDDRPAAIIAAQFDPVLPNLGFVQAGGSKASIKPPRERDAAQNGSFRDVAFRALVGVPSPCKRRKGVWREAVDGAGVRVTAARTGNIALPARSDGK